MKKISALLIISIIIVTFCMIYLVFSGISLRTEPLIQPSVISTDSNNIASSLVPRLFRELQQAHYIVWGILPETQISQIVLKQAAAEYKKTFHQSVRYIPDAEKATTAQIRACEKPCWLTVSNAKAHRLESNGFIEKNLSPFGDEFITLTIVLFNRGQIVDKECEKQKRLNFSCLISISVREVLRKMKDPAQHYFFLRKYNENDFFLFIEAKFDHVKISSNSSYI